MQQFELYDVEIDELVDSFPFFNMLLEYLELSPEIELNVVRSTE